jgi:hypothetical protein
MRQSGDEKLADQTEIALILLDIPALEGSHPQELFYQEFRTKILTPGMTES